MLAFLQRYTSVQPTSNISDDSCPYPGQRMRVEGLSTSKHYNGLIARVELRLEGGRYGVVLERPDGKVLSLKGVNLTPVGPECLQ